MNTRHDSGQTESLLLYCRGEGGGFRALSHDTHRTHSALVWLTGRAVRARISTRPYRTLRLPYPFFLQMQWPNIANPNAVGVVYMLPSVGRETANTRTDTRTDSDTITKNNRDTVKSPYLLTVLRYCIYSTSGDPTRDRVSAGRAALAVGTVLVATVPSPRLRMSTTCRIGAVLGRPACVHCPGLYVAMRRSTSHMSTSDIDPALSYAPQRSCTPSPSGSFEGRVLRKG